MVNRFIVSGIIFSVFLLTSCGQSVHQSGQVFFKIKFPSTQFQTQLIKPETHSIVAAIYGTNIPISTPILSDIITPSTPQTTLSVPIGKQTVICAAYGPDKEILTAGRAETTVRAVTQLKIELIENFRSVLSSDEIAILEKQRDLLPTPNPSAPPVIQAPTIEIQPSTSEIKDSNVNPPPLKEPASATSSSTDGSTAPQPQPVPTEVTTINNRGSLIPITPINGGGSSGDTGSDSGSGSPSPKVSITTTDGTVLITDNSNVQGEDE